MWAERVGSELEAIRRADRWRHPVDLDATDAVSGVVDGRKMVSFASNDYLGLTRHPAVIAAAHEALDRYGSGTGASRLVVGSRPLHRELEQELADWKSSEDAVLFPTGFAANLGVLASFGRADVTVLSDELNHASIIDGCRLSRAQVQVYRHADLDHLAKCLAELDGPALVVTDTVFSMDGDSVDLPALMALADTYGALVMLDEAHAVLGPELPPASDDAPILRVGTLSKTLGSLGGFVAGPRPCIDLLRNVARPFIFTTALTPADTAAALAALKVTRSAEGADLRAKLRGHVDRLRGGPGHPSPILPVILGDEIAAQAAAAGLAERGLLVPAIRPPTVAVGTSRLRVALSAAHDGAQIGALLEGLEATVPGGVAAMRARWDGLD